MNKMPVSKGEKRDHLKGACSAQNPGNLELVPSKQGGGGGGTGDKLTVSFVNGLQLGRGEGKTASISPPVFLRGRRQTKL